MPAGAIHVVVLEERRGRQHDVGEPGGVGHELLVHADEKIVAQEAGAHGPGVRAHDGRIHVLHQHRGDRRAVAEIGAVASEDRPGARLVEHADRWVKPEPWDLGVFACAGLELARKRYLILKSRMYYRPVFAPLAGVIIECASAGVCSSDFSLFDYRKLTRPIYPLDE